jgi:hypothetical protein
VLGQRIGTKLVRMAVPGARTVGALTSVFLISGCGHVSASDVDTGISSEPGLSQSDTTSASDNRSRRTGDILSADDAAAGIRFELHGSRLRLTPLVSGDKLPAFIARPSIYFCGTRDEFGPYAASHVKRVARPRTDLKSIEVVFPRSLTDGTAFCGVETVDGQDEAFAFFIPLDDLVGESP